ELKRHVNEQGYDTRWASEITNISEKIIITLAEEYAKAKPAAIFTNAGIAHHINAFDTFRVLLFLISITGNIGKPGAGANFTNNAGISKSLDKKLKNDSLYKEKSKKIVKGLPSHPDYFAKSILLNSPVPEDKSIKPYSLRSVYYAGNMLTQNANTEEVERALASPTLELFIKPALFWEEDCYYADYILPVKTHLESDGIGVRRDDRAARWKNVVIDATDIYTDPEIISEDELWIRLGEAVKLKEIEKKDELIKHNRFCLDTSFWERYLPSDWKNQQGVWKEIGKQNPSSARFSYENMKGRTEPLHWPCPDIKDSNGKPHPGTGILYTDEKDDRGFWLETSIGSGKFEKGEKHKRFWTSDGKVLIYTKNLDRTLRGLQPDEPEETLKDLSNTKTGHTALPKFYTDPIYPNLPTMSYTNNKWIKNPIKTNNMTMQAEIVNAPSDEKNSKYPYLLITGRPTAVHFHSYSHWMWHSVQMNAHRTIQINPKTADILKVKKNGENVKIETTWGVISAPVLIWDGLADNTVFIPIGFGDKQQVHKDTRKPIYSSVNILTNNEIFDTLSYQMPYKLHRCMIKNLGDCKRFDTNL
ncbi:MAG: molybdopterin-dependent oxidoreductase, partial [Candidatus Hydrothermarchaeales archaeon]